MTVVETGPPGPPDQEPVPYRRGLTRRRGLTVLVAAVLVGGAAGAAAFFVPDRAGDDPGTGPRTSTAPVVRTDLAQRTQLDGKLDYAGSHKVAANARGTVTWLPAEGQVIRRGQRVYGVDGRPVPLLYGATPLWRALAQGMTDGPDVTLLERNLVRLGHGSALAVDDHFSAATAAAVKKWQKALGVTASGTVQPGDVVVKPGALRVTSVTGVLGAPAGGEVFTASGTERRILVDMPVGQQELAVVGAAVRIQLPGGKSATGKVSSVGKVATGGDDGDEQQPGAGTETATLPVVITLDRAADAGRFDKAPVTVGFTSGVRKNVLAVPVSALVAMPDGSYAVRVVAADGTARRVPVELGVFADGKVEVTGALTAGTTVEVPGA
ncbi:efflux RND transporter periplasmic adaptor subunit [Streptomyces sp. NPDC051018]|uniref:efflux RND transporter periplasmic adaptor subunit n=1 Tax=Streptomyces sp. NPDC051018 TaxID=3365639 RepID=UPI00378E0076